MTVHYSAVGQDSDPVRVNGQDRNPVLRLLRNPERSSRRDRIPRRGTLPQFSIALAPHAMNWYRTPPESLGGVYQRGEGASVYVVEAGRASRHVGGRGAAT